MTLSGFTALVARLRAAWSSTTPATPAPKRRKISLAPGTGLGATFDTSRLVATALFVATVVSIVLVSFVGVTNRTLPVLPNQISAVRIAASMPFRYDSAEKTLAARERIRERVPPVYRLDSAPLTRFEAHMGELVAALAPYAALDSAARARLLLNATAAHNARGPYRALPEDVAVLAGFRADRNQLLDFALEVLRVIHRQGIFDPSLLGGGLGGSQIKIFHVLRPDGSAATRPVESLEDALTFFRINIGAEAPDRATALALYRVLREGIVPNLENDQVATAARREEAVRDMVPVSISVELGQTIIEPGTRVTPEQFEMLEAHRQALAATTTPIDETMLLGGRILLVLAMLAASLIYIRLEDPETLQSNSRLALLALVVLVNLALVRATYALGSLDFFLENTTAASLLPYLAPVIIAPLIVALLIDGGSAIFMALFISIFTSVIWGGRLDLLVLEFLAALVAIQGVQHTRRRNQILRAALLAGVSLAVGIVLLGLAEQIPVHVIAKQVGAGLAAAVLCGVLVVGLLPVLENLFKRTTDITLLELTDYNHPLLRLMQLEAPGTYHHSLVVAQLAENASAAIGANPLLARVCALFHDIGKTAKAHYFSENQSDGQNPHDDNNPSLSALIIKAHVKGGVDLALRHKLPRPVIDVIQQHHGTTLIRYFYHRALQALRQNPDSDSPLPPLLGLSSEPPRESAKTTAPFRVSGTTTPAHLTLPEQTYRYDGPRPRFKESAIIHLADGIEAAARSLPKVTPQHLGELIEKIVRDRMNDGQLDESPLTFAELSKIQESFAHTLLSMLHGRVAYPTATLK
ncbi:MAG: HDIG domain-containing protein [Verrucomicrobia bacterium]|nr:MAG: HDIG domain-containing protein [Verrucomicrobiota bacterium]